MSTEANKGLIRRLFEEGYNQNQPAVYDELIAPDYVNYNFPAPAPGREGWKLTAAAFLAAFPDMHVTVEDLIAEGDRVASRGYFTGTHKGEFQGIPPTGKPIRVPFIDVWRVRNGQGAGNWVQMDMMALLQQLGVMPAPSAA